MIDKGDKYWRTLVGIKNGKIDIYGVCETFDLGPARSHAAKKLLMAGKRGVKSIVQDLEEAITAIERDIEIIKESQDGWKKNEES